jgi:hypothetical protein
LELFAAGLQFLRGGAQLLVHGLKFLVAGLHFLRIGLVLLDCLPQVRFELLQFAFEVGHDRFGRGGNQGGRERAGVRVRIAQLEFDQQISRRDLIGGLHPDINHPRGALHLGRHRGDMNRPLGFRGPKERGAQFHPQGGQHEPQHIDRGLPPGDLKKAAGAFRQMHDRVLRRHQNGWSRQLFEQPKMKFGYAGPAGSIGNRPPGRLAGINDKPAPVNGRLGERPLMRLQRPLEGARTGRNGEERSSHRLMRIQPVLFIDDPKERAFVGDGFRTAKKEHPIRAQRELEGVEHSLLRVTVEINQEIAAGNQIHPRKRSVPDQVMHGEQHNLAQFTPHAVTPLVLDEEAAKALVAYVLRDRIGIKSAARLLNGRVVEVAGEDLNRGRRIQLADVLYKHHGHGIRFLARGAGRDPNPHNIIRTLIRKQLGNVPLQRLISFPVAEKVGHRNEQVVQQGPGFSRMGSHECQVRRDVVQAIDLQAAGDPADNRGALVVGKIAPGPDAQIGQDLSQGVFVLVRARRN